MNSKLAFLLASFPGESLPSLISRYHHISGNLVLSSTTNDLFGKKRLSLSHVSMEKLRWIIRGNEAAGEQYLDVIIKKASMFPLYATFLAQDSYLPRVKKESVLINTTKTVSGGNHPIAICIECLGVDRKEYGVGYLHRAHQIKGVGVCWKHACDLVTRCYQCNAGFGGPISEVSVSWLGCECGWVPWSAKKTFSHFDRHLSFAVFAKELIDASLKPISYQRLHLIYAEQFKSITSSSYFSVGAMYEFIRSNYGESFLYSIDSVFKSSTVGMSDEARLHFMPISRHLLISYALFETFDAFKMAVSVIR